LRSRANVKPCCATDEAANRSEGNGRAMDSSRRLWGTAQAQTQRAFLSVKHSAPEAGWAREKHGRRVAAGHFHAGRESYLASNVGPAPMEPMHVPH